VKEVEQKETNSNIFFFTFNAPLFSTVGKSQRVPSNNIIHLVDASQIHKAK
jgi:hypothetical protein